MIARVALDYTEWAPPLYEDAVKADINAYREQFNRTPGKIIMWVHQWEYMAKKYKWDTREPRWVIADTEAYVGGILATLTRREASLGGRLWGIPVEVRDPEEQKP